MQSVVVATGELGVARHIVFTGLSRTTEIKLPKCFVQMAQNFALSFFDSRLKPRCVTLPLLQSD